MNASGFAAKGAGKTVSEGAKYSGFFRLCSRSDMGTPAT